MIRGTSSEIPAQCLQPLHDPDEQPEQELDEPDEQVQSSPQPQEEPPPIENVLMRRWVFLHLHLGQGGLGALDDRSRSSNRCSQRGHSNSKIGISIPWRTINGAGDRTRTGNSQLGKLALYH